MNIEFNLYKVNITYRISPIRLTTLWGPNAKDKYKVCYPMRHLNREVAPKFVPFAKYY
jgi:hypothetical protein